MSFTAILIILLALGSIIGAIIVLKKSAKKFNLSAEQLKMIKERNNILNKEEEADKNH